MKKTQYRILQHVFGTEVRYYPQIQMRFLGIPISWDFFCFSKDCPIPQDTKELGNFFCKVLDADEGMFGSDMDYEILKYESERRIFFNSKEAAENFLKLRPPVFIDLDRVNIIDVEV